MKKLEELKELKEKIERYSIDYDDALWQLQELDENNEFTSDFITYDEAEELAKEELKNGGLMRLYCFIDRVDLSANIFRIDGYGNLQNCYRDDLIDAIDDMIANEEGDR